MKYYAGYNSMKTDVAMFNTKAERDEWVQDENSAFERIQLTRREAISIVGTKAELHKDELNDHIMWMINPLNIHYINS